MISLMSERALGLGDRPDFIEGWLPFSGPMRRMDPRAYVVQKLIHIIDLSAQAREQLGESYRGFKVGCAVLALDESGGRTGVYFGGNFTPYRGADWNCAEKRALESVESKGFDTVLALAVTGEPQVDNSGVESPTLHPCSRCRHLFAESGLILPETLIATATPDLENFELHSLISLMRRHTLEEPQPFPDYHPSLPNYWSQVLEMNRHAEEDRYEAAVLAEMFRMRS